MVIVETLYLGRDIQNSPPNNFDMTVLLILVSVALCFLGGYLIGASEPLEVAMGVILGIAGVFIFLLATDKRASEISVAEKPSVCEHCGK